MLKSIVELGHLACVVRGLITPETYIVSMEFGEAMGRGVKTPVVRGFIEGFSTVSALPIVMPIQGAKAFGRDICKLGRAVLSVVAK